MSAFEKTYEGLRDLIIREQYLNVSPQDLMLFIRERKPATNVLMATLAESFADAHRVSSAVTRPKAPFSKKFDPQFKAQKKPDGFLKISTPGSKPEGTGEERTCFICSKRCHVAKDCFHRNKPKLGAMFVKNSLNDPKSASTPAATGFACKTHHKFNCGECMVIPEGSNPHSCGALITSSDGELELKCGCFVPVLNPCRERMNSQQSSIMPVVTGYIGGRPVQVLRDTGCPTVVVRRSLVTDKQLTGESQLCVLIDGTARKALCARIYVDTLFYTGSVQAICI